MTPSPAWRKVRVIVVDTETTGLATTSRIVSMAFNEIRGGRILGQFATLVDPGLAVIGASHIHKITAETLREAKAPSFAAIAAVVRGWLTPRAGETLILAGFKVAFDALRLRYEFEHIGQALPPDLRLLDVRWLAERLKVSARGLSDLAASLKISSDDPHTAVSDARVAALALIKLVEELAKAEPGARLDALATPFDPSIQVTKSGTIRSTQSALPPLTPQHVAAHAANLTRAKSREAALAVCVEEQCTELARRCEEGVSNKKQAVEVLDWIRGQLRRRTITRATRGRLLDGLCRVLARTEDPVRMRAEFDDITKAADRLGVCGATDKCDRCAETPSPRLCRFREVRFALLEAFMYEDGALSVSRARDFLPFQLGMAQPAGWFAELMESGDTDAAGYGAQLTSRAGPESRKRGWERAVLAYAWAAGARNAVLADHYSSHILADVLTGTPSGRMDEALRVIDETLAARGADVGRVWDQLIARRERTLARKNAPPRAAPSTRRNLRAARPNRFIPPGEEPER